MNKSKHATIVFVFVALSTASMLFDYALMIPSPILSLLPGFYAGVYAVLGVVHIFDLIKQHKTKD